MKLEKKYNQNNGEYYCDITRMLDELCGYAIRYPRYKHYVCDTRDLWNNCFAIRVPGRTTGSIEVNTNNVITKISLSSELVGDIKQYPSSIYKEVEKYIGETLEM